MVVVRMLTAVVVVVVVIVGMVPVRLAMIVMVLRLIVRVLVALVAGRIPDVELGRRDACSKHSSRADLISRHREAAERTFQVADRQTGVDQRAKHHVA